MNLLFSTEEELKQFLPLTASFKLAAVAPFLHRVQQREIREALGYAQLTALADGYAAATPQAPLTASLVKLLAAVRVPLAAHAFALHSPHGGVQLTASGAKQASTEHMRPADRAALAAQAAAFTEAGHAGIEALLEFLEENRADYPAWANSDACTVLHGELLATAKEFDRFVFIDRSRRRFLELQPALRDAQRLAIRPLLGEGMLEELRSEKQAGSLTAPNKLLLSYVQPALASAAVLADPVRAMMAATYLEELRFFLYGNADNYPTFKASAAYRPESTTQLERDGEWGFHAAL